MKYLPQLSKEELRYICSQIPHQHATEYFKKHPKEFTKIRRGFRPNKLSKREVETILINNSKQSFITKFIEKHIEEWIKSIQEHIEKCIQEGNSRELAYIRTLSHSYFLGNIQLYFKLVGESYSEEYVGFIDALTKLSKEFTDTSNNLEKELKRLETINSNFISDYDSRLAKYKDKFEEKLINSLTELKDVSQKIVKLESLFAEIAANQKRVESRMVENTELNEKIEVLAKEVNDLKNAAILNEESLSTRVGTTQDYIYDDIGNLPTPKVPVNIDEFKEYLTYNLKALGVKESSDYFRYLVTHFSNLLFQGTPIITGHSIGLNLIKCIGNALIGSQNIKVLIYDQGTTPNQIDDFIKSAGRIVGLANFLGNFNETELIPIFEKHRDKIIFVTVAYNRTLNYISKEFLQYCRYLNLDRISILSLPVTLSEDPSTLDEQNHFFSFNYDSNRYQRILKQILNELDFSQSQIERYGFYVKDEDDLCGLLAFEILPYCTDVLQINPYNKSNQLSRYAGHEGRCPIKDLLLRWFAQ